jgi:hypothetical protein
MDILYELDKYLDNGYLFEKYSLVPTDYDNEENVSFETLFDGDKLATIKIQTIDGGAVDAVEGDFDFKDVQPIVDIDITDREDMFDIRRVQNWIVDELVSIGYDQNPILVNGEEIEVTPSEDPNDENIANVEDRVSDIDDRPFSIDDLDKEE